jgi:parallel beta-helix repeat protein/surface protein
MKTIAKITFFSFLFVFQFSLAKNEIVMNDDGCNTNINVVETGTATKNTLKPPCIGTITTTDNGLNFDGINDNVEITTACTSDLFPGGSAVSVEYWFKGSDLQSAVRFQDFSSNWIVAGWNGAGTGPTQHILSNDGGVNGISVGNGFDDGIWHHIAFTWQQNTTNGFKSYLDGQLVEERDSANTPIAAFSSGFFLGAFNGTGEFTSGALDRVRIWTVARTSAEIQQSFNGQYDNSQPGLLHAFDFDHGVPDADNTGINVVANTANPDAPGLLNNFSLNGNTSNWVDVVTCLGGDTLYVNASATGNNDGSSWSNAFTDLQSALDNTDACKTQIWVAEGTYKPSAYPENCTGCATDRDFTFQLRDGMSLYGGFAGNESSLDDRNFIANETILSGDIGILNNDSDNVFHVVLACFQDTTPITRLDGFIVKAGNANLNSFINSNGESISRRSGGGIYLQYGTNLLTNNTVSENFSTFGGGGIRTQESVNTIVSNVISGNETNGDGGAIYTAFGTNKLVNNLISGNIANDRAGGIFLSSGSNTLTNNTVSGNTAVNNGGGIFAFFGNYTLSNNIIWGNNSGLVNQNTITFNVNYNIVQGGFAGTGNLDQDPMFVSPLGSPGLSTAGNFRLQDNSPAINTGDDTAYQNATGNDPATDTDLDGNVRRIGSSVDMGAYELLANNQFFLGANGVTCLCPDAAIGDTGTLVINGVPKTFTKRLRADASGVVGLDNLIANDVTDPEIALTCTSAITDMSNLFAGTFDNRNAINQDISSWDVSNVADMRNMFLFADSFNQPLNDWDVSSVINMESMFNRAFIFNQALDEWNVSSVTNMINMFLFANKFNQSINNWNTSSVENMAGTFRFARDFNQPLNDWDVSGVTDMNNMFNGAGDFDQPLNNWDVSGVTDMNQMFRDAFAYNQDISNWCVQNIIAEPSNFSTNSPLQSNFKPLWGQSCTDVTWTGVANSDWNNTANWRPSVLPIVTSNIVVDTQNFQPVIDNATQAEIGNLIVLDGNAIDVVGVLKANGFMHNNGTLNFKRNANGSGQLDEFNGTVSGNGEVTVERYIPAKRAFRLLSSPVTTTNFIFENWQESGSTPVTQDGLGTHITGGVASLGFDQSGSNAPSMFTFNNATQNWEALDNTNATKLVAGEAYLTMVRGDRSVDLTSNDSPASPTTLRATGDLLTGASSPALSTPLGSFSLVANPYQAVVDYSLVSKTDLTDFIYVWDASITGVNGRGGYVTVDVSGNTTPPNPFSSDASKFIPSGLSFFVQNVSSGTITPSISFNEDDKATAGGQVTVFNDYPNFYINSRLYLSSDLEDGTTERDAIGLRFSDGFTTLGSDEDATKLSNPDESYAIVNNGLRSIDNQGIPSLGNEIELSISNYTASDYSLTFVMQNKPEDFGVFLVDNYLNTQTELTESFVYDFAVDQNIPESIAENRFKLKIDNTTLGTKENVFGSDFSLYPNPTTNGQFTIKTPNLSGEVSVEISNLLGQKVYNQTMNVETNHEVNINAEGLSTGVYVVELKQGEKSYRTKLIVE